MLVSRIADGTPATTTDLSTPEDSDTSSPVPADPNVIVNQVWKPLKAAGHPIRGFMTWSTGPPALSWQQNGAVDLIAQTAAGVHTIQKTLSTT